MSRVFLSHSSANNAEAIAIRDWMLQNGWNDTFLDLDPERGLKAGERWQDALKRAAERCEMVVFLVSPVWAASKWCLAEFLQAKSLNKRIFALIVEPTPFADLPVELTAEWQVVDLTAGSRDFSATVTLPPGDRTATVSFASFGLHRLRIGLMQAGIDAKHFAWPPAHDQKRPPYRGLKPLEEEDAGIFFGREAPVITALDQLRGLREAAPPRLFVVLGASGAGKSSFLRAGLLPRLRRDDRSFWVLPIIRPERAAISGETGLLRSLEGAFQAAKVPVSRADLRVAIEAGAEILRPFLQTLAAHVAVPTIDSTVRGQPPTLVLAIDQGEELFIAEGQEEAERLLQLLRELSADDTPALVVLFTIRSDNYERLQLARSLEGLRQVTLSLPPMPKGSYTEVIEGPARRLEGSARPLKIEAALVQDLLADIEAGGAKDALPLLAFTLERLYSEFHAGGDLNLEHYKRLGGVTGSIEAAVERAFKSADMDPQIPKDRQSRLMLLRRGLIPWIAGIDHETGAPRRRVARMSEIPDASRPLIKHLVEQRLLATDFETGSGASTIEPAHEALLRQWSLLGGWLKEDAGFLSVIDGIQRAARDWDDHCRSASWLTHTAGRLEAAERLSDRADLMALLATRDKDYLIDCRKAEAAASIRTKRARILSNTLLIAMIIGLVGWINQASLKEQVHYLVTVRPYIVANIEQHVLTEKAERALKPGESFRECAKDCPEMIVVPAGSFLMGSPETEQGRGNNESPQQKITFALPLAVSKFPLMFVDWDACHALGECPKISDSDIDRSSSPAINVTWHEAKRYVGWLSRMTGKPYRLLTEAEGEYAARAGTTTAYSWGDEIGTTNANCSGCGSKWDGRQASPVGSFKPNAFGLFDMNGNVDQWVEDCYYDSLDGVPADGSARTKPDCTRRVHRGGSWGSKPIYLRSASRVRNDPFFRSYSIGFRVARTLLPPSP